MIKMTMSVSLDDLEFFDLLGSGSFGEVNHFETLINYKNKGEVSKIIKN